jgi:hypothetical protein
LCERLGRAQHVEEDERRVGGLGLVGGHVSGR